MNLLNEMRKLSQLNSCLYYSLKERPISPTPGPIGHPTANISSMPSSSPNQNNGSPMGTMPPCPGGAAGMPQQQTPLMNSQGVQPAVFRPAQTQVYFTTKSNLLKCNLSLFCFFVFWLSRSRNSAPCLQV
jgi:hypothetical protein